MREVPSPQRSDRFPEASERSPTRNSALSMLDLGRVNDLDVAEAGTAIASGVMKDTEKELNFVSAKQQPQMKSNFDGSGKTINGAEHSLSQTTAIAPVGEYGSSFLAKFCGVEC